MRAAAHDAAVLQALLSLAASLVRAARESGSADTCSQLLDALDTRALLHTLGSVIVANEEAAYATRLAAVKLLGELVGCVGDTWRYQGSSPGKLKAASRWLWPARGTTQPGSSWLWCACVQGVVGMPLQLRRSAPWCATSACPSTTHAWEAGGTRRCCAPAWLSCLA